MKHHQGRNTKKSQKCVWKYKKLCAAGKINFYYTHHDTLDKHQN